MVTGTRFLGSVPHSCSENGATGPSLIGKPGADRSVRRFFRKWGWVGHRLAQVQFAKILLWCRGAVLGPCCKLLPMCEGGPARGAHILSRVPGRGGQCVAHIFWNERGGRAWHTCFERCSGLEGPALGALFWSARGRRPAHLFRGVCQF